ncbi:proteasome subunit alpha type-5 isoform X3 [Petaurus breviceps papuanus]|uniref:proteasome subunit alpha type-5 isoform X3 n=1 Tax=Petaurus breviceps papuanus TaxID=3040969 RepID=UPI0036DC1203
MFLTRSEYDRGVNTFSPEGRLFQVEYAIEAIKLGSTAIGIQTSEGVCLAVEKRITSPLMEPSSIEKIVEIDAHIGCAMSGLIADAKTLIDKARVETQNHWFTYNETMTVESVTQAVSNLALQFGEEDADPGAMSRPFGVALLFGGVDEKGPQLFHMDPLEPLHIVVLGELALLHKVSRVPCRKSITRELKPGLVWGQVLPPAQTGSNQVTCTLSA